MSEAPRDAGDLYTTVNQLRRLETYGVTLNAKGFDVAGIMVGPARLAFAGNGTACPIDAKSAPAALLDLLEQLASVTVYGPDGSETELDLHDTLRKIQKAPCLTPTEFSVIELLLRTVFRG